MKNDFEKILENLKKETSYSLDIKDLKENDSNLDDKSTVNNFNYETKYRFEEEKRISSKFNVIWSENKETLLFFLIISAIVILIGLISSTDYIIFIGVFSFLLSCIIIFITFYRYILTVSTKVSLPSNIIERIERLETKINYLMKETKESKNGVSYDVVSEINEIKAVLKRLVEVNKKK